MPVCSAQDCSNSCFNRPDLSYHHFPWSGKKSVLETWISRCGREKDWRPTKTARLCSAHFIETDFCRDLQGELMPDHNSDKRRRKKLHPGSIPTIFSYPGARPPPSLGRPTSIARAKQAAHAEAVEEILRSYDAKQAKNVQQEETQAGPSRPQSPPSFILQAEQPDVDLSLLPIVIQPDSTLEDEHLHPDQLLTQNDYRRDHPYSRSPLELCTLLRGKVVNEALEREKITSDLVEPAIEEVNSQYAFSVDESLNLISTDIKTSDASTQTDSQVEINPPEFLSQLTQNCVNYALNLPIDHAKHWAQLMKLFLVNNPSSSSNIQLLLHLYLVHAQNCDQCFQKYRLPKQNAIVCLEASKERQTCNQAKSNDQEILIEKNKEETQSSEEERVPVKPCSVRLMRLSENNCIQNVPSGGHQNSEEEEKIEEESDEECFIDRNQLEENDPDFVPYNLDGDEITIHVRPRRQLQPLPPPPAKYVTCGVCRKKNIALTSIHAHALNVHPSHVDTVSIQMLLGARSKRLCTKDRVQKKKLKKCLKCKRKFVFWSSLMKHIAACDSQQQVSMVKYNRPGRWQCGKCAYSFGLRSRLKLHEILDHKLPLRQRNAKQVLAQRSAVYKDFCAVYRRKYQPFLRHILHVKTSWPPEGSSRLKAFHRQQFQVTCQFCFRRFHSSVRKREHLYKAHQFRSKTLRYFCDLCPQGFASRGRLNSHCTEKHGHKLLCQYCARRFLTPYSLKCHVQLEHEQHSLPCEQCDKTFKSARQLQKHIMIVHRMRQPPTCSWEGCNQTFSDNYNLKVHMRRHTGDKPYACDRCGFRCIQKNSLNHHMLKSHGIQIRRTRDQLNQ